MADIEKYIKRVGYSQLDNLVETLGDHGLLAVITDRMMEGKRPTDVAKSLDLPWLVMWEWVSAKPERQRAYDMAHEAMSQEWHRETIDIADGTYGEAMDRGIGVGEAVSAAKLRIDTRFKVVGNYDKKRFGTVQQPVGSGFAGGVTIVIGEVKVPGAIGVVETAERVVDALESQAVPVAVGVTPVVAVPAVAVPAVVAEEV